MNRPADDHPRYSISVAAELAGMHPQTLRGYEAKGLVRPRRTPGGTRRYSDRDVERLHKIAMLTGDLGMNLAGATRVLDLEKAMEQMAAEMAALTLKEVAGVPAEAMVGADFRHGPLELIDAHLAVAFLALEPATAPIDRSFAAELAAGPASVVVIAGDGAPLSGAHSVAIGRVDRRLAPALAIIPFQLLARELAIARGRRPGQFSLASKVTARE